MMRFLFNPYDYLGRHPGLCLFLMLVLLLIEGMVEHA